jgi:hypothetical protein
MILNNLLLIPGFSVLGVVGWRFFERYPSGKVAVLLALVPLAGFGLAANFC